jgi:hypothetical protein
LSEIGDFGISIKMEDWKAGEHEDGDAKYIAPELLESGIVSPACDMFSLGVSLYEIVTDAVLPTNGLHWEDLRKGKLDFESTKYSDRYIPISSETRHMIESLMSPNPVKSKSFSDFALNFQGPKAQDILDMGLSITSPHFRPVTRSHVQNARRRLHF